MTLEQMHIAAKNRKEAIEIQKEEAQSKAKEHIKRIKQCQALIAAILP